jgi:DmsE family decaheme c-type cytochrome
MAVPAGVPCRLLSAVLFAAAADGNRPASFHQPQARAPAAQEYAGAEVCATCHHDVFAYYRQTPHATITDVAGWKTPNPGCEGCHGPGKAHVDGGGDPSLIRTFAGLPPRQVSEVCLRCHSGTQEHNNFRRGGHGRADVSCLSCHAPHSDASSSPHMLTAAQTQLCLTCHAEVRGQFARTFHHRVLEGAMQCTDCHNPHGGFEPKQARIAVGADVPCLKCHADKQGPFVFEHAPLKVEGCAICHQPHGSNNPRLLVRSQVRQLCLECHSNTGTIGAPNTPTFHNQASVSFQNCTLCHVKIHGSNLDPVFFR